MDKKELVEILDYFEQSHINELELEKEGDFFLRLKKKSHGNSRRKKSANTNDSKTNNAVNSSPLGEQIEIKSERVGHLNFFVDEGNTVKKGQILYEIVSLKTPTSIESPCDGKIIKIYPENGEPVEYGQLIMEIQIIEIKKN